MFRLSDEISRSRCLTEISRDKEEESQRSTFSHVKISPASRRASLTYFTDPGGVCGILVCDGVGTGEGRGRGEKGGGSEIRAKESSKTHRPLLRFFARGMAQKFRYSPEVASNGSDGDD